MLSLTECHRQIPSIGGVAVLLVKCRTAGVGSEQGKPSGCGPPHCLKLRKLQLSVGADVSKLEVIYLEGSFPVAVKDESMAACREAFLCWNLPRPPSASTPPLEGIIAGLHADSGFMVFVPPSAPAFHRAHPNRPFSRFPHIAGF